jgi:hypothetical protein
MRKYVMNKNVMHNGKSYKKGDEIQESHDGFKEIVSGGHADELKFEDAAEAPVEDAPEAPAAEGSADEESHSKRHGRRR